MKIKFILAGSIIFMLILFTKEGGIASQASDKLDEGGGTVIPVSLQKLAQEIVKRNASAINDYLRSQISKEVIKAEKGIFEPILQASYNRQQIHVPNTTENILTRQQADYFEKTDAFDVGVSGTTSIGSQWNLKLVDNRRGSSTIDKFRNYEYEYDNSLKLSLEQPLLKGFGKDVTLAKIDLAKIQSEIDENKFEQKLMELVGVTIQLYWRLYGARQIYQSWEKSLKIAEDSLKDIELRVKGGKIASTDLMEAQSAISIRRGELYNARSKVVEAQNQLMTLLNISASDDKGKQLIAADNPFGSYDEILESDEYLKVALERWPEYKNARKAIEKEKIQVRYAKNQVLPQLNFIGTVSTNSLEQEDEKALREVANDKFLSWSVGLKFSMPIFDNAQAKSGFSIAKMRARQADVELDAVVKSLSNSLNSKVEELRNLQEQLMEYEKGLNIKEELLQIEQIKLQSGQTSLKNLLNQQEEYVNYQRKVLSGVVNYKVAEALLEIAVGDILAKYNIDPKDIHYPPEALPTNLRAIFN